MAAQNYRVEIHSFGDWPRGTVLPEFVCLWAFGDAPGDRREQIRELVDRGMVAPTREEVAAKTVERIKEVAGARLKARAAAESPVPEAARVELEELRALARGHEEAAGAHAMRADGAEKRARDLLAEVADYVEKNAHLSRACEEHQASREESEKEVAALKAEVERLKSENAQLHADLEAATAPAAG